jgi:hypothetical protein
VLLLAVSELDAVVLIAVPVVVIVLFVHFLFFDRRTLRTGSFAFTATPLSTPTSREPLPFSHTSGHSGFQFGFIKSFVFIGIHGGHLFAEEGWNFFSGEFPVLIGVGAFHHLIDEITRSRTLTAGALLARPFTGDYLNFFTIEESILIFVPAFNGGLQSFRDFCFGEFAVFISVHCHHAFDHGIAATAALSTGPTTFWTTGAAKTAAKATPPHAFHLRADFRAVQFSVFVSIQRLQRGDCTVNFFFREFAISVFIQRIHQWIRESATHTGRLSEGTAAFRPSAVLRRLSELAATIGPSAFLGRLRNG